MHHFTAAKAPANLDCSRDSRRSNASPDVDQTRTFGTKPHGHASNADQGKAPQRLKHSALVPMPGMVLPLALDAAVVRDLSAVEAA